MPSLRVYDTKGNEHSPTGGGGRTNEQVRDLGPDGVRLAIETGRETTFTAFFRARETRNARTEQFYAVYTARNSSTREFIGALRDRIESDWGYIIDDSADDMSVFRALDARRTSLPGDDRDRSILEELIGSRQTATVGVRNAESALGLVSEFRERCDSIAVADSPESSTLSSFDLVIAPDGSRGIAPLGDTEARWESTKQSLRSQHIDQEIESIKDSVQTLSTEYGLSSSEIRDRVHRRVPALKSSPSGGQLDGLSGSSSSDDLELADVGKYVAVGAVVLILLVGVAWGAMALGFVGGDDPGGDTGDASGEVVAGTVYADPAGEEPAEGVEVTLEPTGAENGSDDQTEGDPATVTTNESGAFTFENASGDYAVSFAADGLTYDEMESVSAGESNLSATPTGWVVSGEVVANGSAVNATVTLLDGNETVGNTTGETYEFEGTAFDGDYRLRVNASGYEPVNRSVESFGTQEALELTASEPEGPTTVSFGGTVTNGSSGEAIEGASVSVATGDDTLTATTGGDGSYTVEDVPTGEHEFTVSADGYRDQTGTVNVTESGVPSGFGDFELEEPSAINGSATNADGDPLLFTIDLTRDGEEIRSGVEAEGNYEIPDLPSGTYEMSVVRGLDGDPVTQEVTLAPGQTQTVDIVIENGSITITVVE